MSPLRRTRKIRPKIDRIRDLIAVALPLLVRPSIAFIQPCWQPHSRSEILPALFAMFSAHQHIVEQRRSQFPLVEGYLLAA